MPECTSGNCFTDSPGVYQALCRALATDYSLSEFLASGFHCISEDSMPHKSHEDAPYQQYSLCSQIADYERGLQTGGREEEDTFLPDAANSLKRARDLKPNSGTRLLQLMQCPECATYYLYKTDYEYLATGSEEEQELIRLTDEEAAEYRERPVQE